MCSEKGKGEAMFTIDVSAFDDLLSAIKAKGYALLGPTIRDRVVVYDQISGSKDLPIGWSDRQEGGTYRLNKRKDQAFFGYSVGPQTWKKFLYPDHLKLWEAHSDGSRIEIEPATPESRRYALIGIRPCELAALAIHDRIFLEGPYLDPHYQALRADTFLLAVNCTEPGGTCFCHSMGSGPAVKQGFDLALTEIVENDDHYFLVNPGSDRGAEILQEVVYHEATAEETARAEKALSDAEYRMGRYMDIDNIRELLYRNLEHPYWEEIAKRCLNCANCTLVCPTCFCSTVEDSTDLSGASASRTRMWDSCFTSQFSYIHGGSVRQSAMARYRQWITHKLASWQDQFGTSGCVGCGRCITWCPVGIDITEAVWALRESEGETRREKTQLTGV